MERPRIPLTVSDPPAHLVGMSTEAITTSGLEPLMSIDDLAAYLGVPVTTIYDWRVSGKGPCAIRVGRHLKFAVSDVRDWVERQRELTPGHVQNDR
ncbi:MAG: phage transcriptional regulator, AlpA [Marmoricola sp.]|nr:phage transcriptional regulator, AlpA [Marmoricola sp.]